LEEWGHSVHPTVGTSRTKGRAEPLLGVLVKKVPSANLKVGGEPENTHNQAIHRRTVKEAVPIWKLLTLQPHQPFRDHNPPLGNL
jgi:hypothetical protein